MKIFVPFAFSIFMVTSDLLWSWNIFQLQVFFLVAILLAAFFQHFSVATPHVLILLSFFIWRYGAGGPEATFLVFAIILFFVTAKFSRDQQKLGAELKQDQHLRALGRLSAMLAHEIRNPLTALSGSIEYLEQNVPDRTRTENKKLFDIMKKEVTRLQNLVTDFLDFSKASTKEFRDLDLSQLIRGWTEFFLLQKKGNLQIQLNLDDAVIVRGVEDRLQQAYLNLLQNAAESSDQPHPVEVTLRRNGPTLSIRDSGRGIATDRLANLFEPFQTTKIKGTGLGLAITKRVFDAHGASIAVASVVDVGTTFTIQFKNEPRGQSL